MRIARQVRSEQTASRDVSCSPRASLRTVPIPRTARRHLGQALVKTFGTLVIGGALLAGLGGAVQDTRAATVDRRILGTNMGLFDSHEQLLSNAGTRQILAGWHTPVIRMPFRSSLSDSVELQALQAINTIGSTPLVVIHGAVDPNVLADGQHLLSLVSQVFGSSLVYVEYGNEEDLAGVNATTYTNSWNAVVPVLKAAHPTYKFMGPVNFQSNSTYIGYFVGHANPKPDLVSWHEYVCNPSSTVSYCMQHIANWATHVANVNNAEIAAVGHAFPFMITEWNMDPFNDTRYLDPSVIGPWTTAALQQLNALIPSGLVGAQQYVADSHGGGFELIDYNNNLTPQGVAFQAATGTAVAAPAAPRPAPAPQQSPPPTSTSGSQPAATPSSVAALPKATLSPTPQKGTPGSPPGPSPTPIQPSAAANLQAAAANRFGMLLVLLGFAIGSVVAGIAFVGWVRYRVRR